MSLRNLYRTQIFIVLIIITKILTHILTHTVTTSSSNGVYRNDVFKRTFFSTFDRIGFWILLVTFAPEPILGLNHPQR